MPREACVLRSTEVHPHCEVAKVCVCVCEHDLKMCVVMHDADMAAPKTSAHSDKIKQIMIEEVELN